MSSSSSNSSCKPLAIDVVETDPLVDDTTVSPSSFISSSKPLAIDVSETDDPLVENKTAHCSNITDRQNELLLRREQECLWLESAYRNRLAWSSVLKPISTSFHVLITTLLGVGFFATGTAKIWLDGVSLFTAFNAAVHKALQCDAFHAECVTMMTKYKTLAHKYRALREISMDVEKLAVYDEELIDIAAAAKMTHNVMAKARRQAPLVTEPES
jgi:hypothetical protein